VESTSWTAAAPFLFVGRQDELACLHSVWETVQGGAARVVGIEGDPGIGKTLLVRRFLAAAGPAAVVWASGDEAEAQLPWGVVSQMAGALPEWPDGSSGSSWDAHLEPIFIGQALVSRLQRLQNAIVVIDDAHWGDRLSMASVRLAARRLAAEPVMLLVTYQPAGATRGIGDGHPSPGLDDGWRRLFDSDRGERLTLTGLRAADLMRLAVAGGHPGLSPIGAARLHEHTGGHPLHARHLLDELPMRSIVYGHGALPAPRDVAVAVKSRLASCQPGTRDLVAAAAVLGRRASLTALYELAGVTDPVGALTDAVEARLLEEVPGLAGRELAFTSSLVLGLVYHNLDPARRRDLHRRAALRGGASVIWHRIAAADGVDEELAGAIEDEAHRHLAADRIPLAALQFRHALELTPTGPARVPRLLAAVEALLVAGDVAAALEYRDEIDAATGPWADYVAGYLLLLIGEVNTSRARLRRAWDETRVAGGGLREPVGLSESMDRSEPVDLRARIATQLAIIGALQASYPDMINYGEVAVASARLPWVAAFAWFAKSLGLAVAGRSAEALSELAAVESPGAPSGLDGLVARGMIRLWIDDLAGARRDLVSALTRAVGGEPLRVAQALGFLGEAEYRCGALGESVVHTEAAVGDAEENNRVWDYAMLHALASYPLAAMGDWERAEFHTARSAARAQHVGAPAGFVYAAASAAAVAQARADTMSLLRAAEKLEVYYPSLEPGTHLSGPLRADVLAQLGKTGEAVEALADFTARAGSAQRRSTQLAIARVRARIAAADGDYHEALRHCRLALQFAEEVGLRLEAARVELLAGEYLCACGRRAAAERSLRSALRQFTAMGAAAYVTQTVHALGRAGLPAEAPPSPLDALTPAERAIATCVCQGLTNRQTAQRLILSTKTVEFHLTNVFRKLDVSGRSELRRVVEVVADAGL
jgi:DNA-binding CsgD family transcriptional regulator